MNFTLHRELQPVTRAQRFLIEPEEDTRDVVLPCNGDSSLLDGFTDWLLFFALPQGTPRAADGISQERTEAQAPSGSGEGIMILPRDYQ